MALGYLSLADLGVPAEIQAMLANHRFTDGVSIEFVLQNMTAGLNAFNTGNSGSPGSDALARLLTTPASIDPGITYSGGSLTTRDATEYGAEPVQRIDKHQAVVIPVGREGAIGFSFDAMRVTDSQHAITTNRRLLEAFGSDRRKAILRTVFTQATVRTTAEGARSPGWVGADGQAYVPPEYEGRTFATDNHVLATATDTAAGRRALFADMAARLWEHGLYSTPGAPLILIHGPATLADVQADAKYVSRQQQYVQYASGAQTNYAALADNLPMDLFHGVLQDSGAWVVNIGGVPDNYFAMVKSYGERSSMNALKTWSPDDLANGFALLDVTSPLPGTYAKRNDFTVRYEAGYGVAVPEMGVVGMVGGASYVDPAIG